MKSGFRAAGWLLGCVVIAAFCLCVCLGSVSIPFNELLDLFKNRLMGLNAPSAYHAILFSVRIPRVLCVALVGAALSICGVAMQGLLRNPLADGSTLGVSSGASLGAAVAILTGFTVPGVPFAGTMILSIIFGFCTLVLLLVIAYALDHTLRTHTIILTGVVFGMFFSSLMSLLITFSGEKLKSLTFWTMGSLAGATYAEGLALLAVLIPCAWYMLFRARELNALSLGEDTARHIGVPVGKVKLGIMIAVSTLIGVCVSIGGCIGFVGLTIPHMVRMVIGSDHKRLLPASMATGAVFLMLADLLARTLLSPLELPIGVITSFVGTFAFFSIVMGQRRRSA